MMVPMTLFVMNLNKVLESILFQYGRWLISLTGWKSRLEAEITFDFCDSNSRIYTLMLRKHC
jgi:hypothetical protein